MSSRRIQGNNSDPFKFKASINPMNGKVKASELDSDDLYKLSKLEPVLIANTDKNTVGVTELGDKSLANDVVAKKYTIVHTTESVGLPQLVKALKHPRETLLDMCERYNVNPYEVDWLLEGWMNDRTHHLLATLDRKDDVVFSQDETDEDDEGNNLH